MNTIVKQKSERPTGKVSLVRFMYYFKKFSKSERMKVAEQINRTTFRECWALVDKALPDLQMTEDEIMDEVRTVRYGGKAKRNSA